MYKTKIIEFILNLVYPHKCMFCDEVININQEKWTCKHCLSELPFIIGDKEPFISIFNYDDKVRSSIHRLKYYNCKDYSKGFAILLYNKFCKTANLNYDLVTFVPMFEKKKKSRGYDQAELIALEFSKLAKITLERNNLIRIKNTLPQSSLDFESRKENISNAFNVKSPNNFKDKNIILIDDIYTTGNTIFQCHNELIKAGANNVCYLTVAKSSYV